MNTVALSCPTPLSLPGDTLTSALTYPGRQSDRPEDSPDACYTVNLRTSNGLYESGVF